MGINEENKQWKEIVWLLNFMERALDKLELYGLYKKHDATVIRNTIKRGWLRVHNFDKDTSQESKDRFNKLFPEDLRTKISEDSPKP